jgi:hypothetical protein
MTALARAYVISLPRRAERLARFLSHVDAMGLSTLIQFEPFSAVDGSRLAMDDELKGRIDPWNFEHVNQERLRGIIGCALSHLEVWRRVSMSNEKVFVFEDDARLIDLELLSLVGQLFERMPNNTDLIWLNDYDMWHRGGARHRARERLRSLSSGLVGPAITAQLLRPRRVHFSKSPDRLTTAEAYLISPAFAGQLHKGIGNNLGAVDRKMSQFVAAHQCRAYQVHPPLFTQADRTDSDTESSPSKTNA